jgi:microsomal dipeptidase-like Zn-dependent dipeptidase
MARIIKGSGSKYGDGTQYPADGIVLFQGPSVLPEVVEELLKKNYQESEVRGILGENFLRVFSEVWK